MEAISVMPLNTNVSLPLQILGHSNESNTRRRRRRPTLTLPHETGVEEGVGWPAPGFELEARSSQA